MCKTKIQVLNYTLSREMRVQGTRVKAPFRYAFLTAFFIAGFDSFCTGLTFLWEIFRVRDPYIMEAW